MGVLELVLGLRMIRGATVAIYALLLYEFLIIFNREYEVIYKSRWSLTKCLYLVRRYGLLLGWPVVIYAYLPDHDAESCRPFLFIVTILLMLFPCFPQCVFILRAYAITGCKRSSLLVYLPCLLAYLFFLCWHSLHDMALLKDGFLILGRTGCFKDFPHGSNGLSPMPFAGIVIDSIIGLMLVIHFIRFKLRCPKTSLENLLTTQGMIYFPLMFLLNTGAAILSTIRGYGAVVIFAIVIISNIMACRCIIQIREHAFNNTYSQEMTSRFTTDVECTFTGGPSVTGTA